MKIKFKIKKKLEYKINKKNNNNTIIYYNKIK